MDDLASKLNEILGNPESMEKIQTLPLSYLDAPLLDVVHRWKQHLGAVR